MRPESSSAGASGVEIAAAGLSVRAGGRWVLNDVSLRVGRGELVAVAGGSGAGKTTLLEALAGVRPAERGAVRFDGVDLYEHLDRFRSRLGYVPQDDIVHAELPLERTLRYAAELRLPPATSRVEGIAAAQAALTALALEGRARVRVGSLSGGQRKRASIAAELLTEPHVFFLDEPTSGLDPVTAAELLRVMRDLADRGSTVLFTTHAVQDLAGCDRVVFLARDGYLVFSGTLEDALRHFDVERAEEVYERLERGAAPEEWARRFAGRSAGVHAAAPVAAAPPPERPAAGFVRQWSVLSRRTLETLARNRLTMAILLGSPAVVVAMFAVLFRPGAFDAASPDPTAIVMIVFWITFGAFFFGVTYGLLQIVGERAIVRREQLVGMRLDAYVLSKVTVLLPFLLFVVALMLVVLRLLDRLPPLSAGTYLSVGATLGLEAAVALTLGLLASAAVGNAAQATLALPMLCFPAVLFSGAILPVNVMAAAGAAISTVVPVRWAFEAVGRDLGAREILAAGGSPLGPPLLEAYGDAGTSATPTYWAYLAAFAFVFFFATWAALAMRSRRAAR